MRPMLPLLLALSLMATSAIAAPPTGTIFCGAVSGEMEFTGLPGVQHPDGPSSKRIRFTMRKAESVCDPSGVVGGRLPITHVQVGFAGWLAAGSTCEALLSTATFEKTKLKATWKAGNAVVGRSVAAVASAVYDPDAQQLVFTSQPITRGAFAGATLTFALGLASSFEGPCQTYAGTFGGMGVDPAFSTLSVP
jgi:hypothetical protein